MVEWNTLGIVDGVLSLIALGLIITGWIFYAKQMDNDQKTKYFWYLVATSILAGLSLLVLMILGVLKIYASRVRTTEIFRSDITIPRGEILTSKPTTSSTGTIVYAIILIPILVSIGLSLYVIIDNELKSSNST